MPDIPTHDITVLLHAARQGDAQAWDRLFNEVYDALHRIAHNVRKVGDTLDTTALVHEAYLKMAGAQQHPWNDRVHFFRVAARAMRQVLVNAARQHMAQKRGGGARAVTFNDEVYSKTVQPKELLALDEALTRLETLNKRQAEVIECRFFAGLTVEETAEVLGVSSPTVKRDWRFAKAWLTKELAES